MKMKKSDVIREQGALLFLDGQFALRYEENQRTVVKLVSPASVRAAFNHIPIDSGWMPDAVRRWGHTSRGEYVVLCFPPQRYHLHLVNDFGDHRSGRKIVEVEIPLPALVFVGHGQAYFVWALAQKDFAPDAGVCHAPLPNVSLDGSICYGDNHPPAASIGTMMSAWQMFIGSPFNGHLASGKSRAFPNDVRGQLLRLTERRARRYPSGDLLRAHGNLSQVVERVIKELEYGR
jgi:PRTRC genetic system protein B